MALTITLKRPTGGGGRTFDEVVPAGLYPATCVAVEECQKKKYQSEDLEDALKFVFKLQSGVEGRYVTSVSLASKPNKSKLYKVVEALDPEAIRKGHLNKDETALRVIEGLKGKNCMLNVTVVSKGDMEYSNIEAVMPPVAHQAAAPARQDVNDIPLADDDIPF
jgi:hypothetical protein